MNLNVYESTFFLLGNALIRASHLYFFKKVLSLRRNAFTEKMLYVEAFGLNAFSNAPLISYS